MAVDLPTPRVGVPGAENGSGALPVVAAPAALGIMQQAAPEPMRVVLNWGRRYSLWVFNFGLACCAIEFIATSMARHDFIRLGVIPFAPGPRQADLMVVSGTVSDKMAPAVKRLYDQMPEPKYVISFGSCANCGGPYWDSYCVTKGVDQIIPVDVYVPGCPPRPEALLQGIIKLQEKIAGEDLPARYKGGDARPAPKMPRFRRTPKARKEVSVGAASIAAPTIVAGPNAAPNPAAETMILPPVPPVPVAPPPLPEEELFRPERPVGSPPPAAPRSAATVPLPPTVEHTAISPVPDDEGTEILPVVPPTGGKPPRLFYRRYPKELRRSRDIGLNILNQKRDPDDD